jgi:predicted metal-binding membrane protein
MTDRAGAIEGLLRHERMIVLAALAVICLASWAWVLAGSGTGMSISAMTTFAFPPPAAMSVPMEWNATYALLMLAMWWVMMIAMMLPSAAPVILLYAQAWRHQQRLGRFAAGNPPVAAFTSGYLLAWLGFSLVATGLQFALERAGIMDSMLMWSTSSTLTGTLLVVAGMYQFVPIKQACLVKCRSPAAVIAELFRPGTAGAMQMGLRHGTACVGCCWALMALLFAGGIMNLVWIAGLTAIVIAEKMLPGGRLLSYALGAVLTAAGLWVLL